MTWSLVTIVPSADHTMPLPMPTSVTTDRTCGAVRCTSGGIWSKVKPLAPLASADGVSFDERFVDDEQPASRTSVSVMKAVSDLAAGCILEFLTVRARSETTRPRSVHRQHEVGDELTPGGAVPAGTRRRRR